MRVLLVEPPKKIWELMGGNCISPPLGLAYLAAALEQEGIEVDILDCNASGVGWLGLEDFIREAQPDVIGTSAMTPFFHRALGAARAAKRANPNTVTVLGGPHVTFTAEETLLEHPEVDVVVRGEGERTLVELVRRLEGQGDLATVRGIAFRRDGQVVQTPQPPPLDVNALPLPAYHLLPMHKYVFTVFGKFTTILASRGCPFRCTFCSEWRFWGGRWRPRDPEAVVEEMELLNRKYGRQCFWFGDDCFNVDGEHMRRICEGILRRGLDVSWYYQGRADLVIKYKDLLPLMRRAGNLMVQIGVESSTDEELSRFRKRLTTDQVREAVELLRENDIVCQGLIIVGTRDDDPRSIMHKVRYAKRLDLDFPIFTMYTPFPGNEVYERARAKGWLEVRDYSKYDMAHAVMPTEHLTRRQLISWYYWCFSNYYLDPVKLAKGLFSRNEWKRKVWRHMLAYIGKQIVRSWF